MARDLIGEMTRELVGALVGALALALAEVPYFDSVYE